MFIDIHVHPAFYEPINRDPAREKMRHKALDIHKNGTAPLEHIFSQMRCAGLDRLCLLAQDYTSSIGQTVVSNQEIRDLLDLAPDRFFGFASVDPHDPNAAGKLEDAFARLKLQGLNLHPGRQIFLPSALELEPIYAICERRLGHPLEFEAVAAAHPNLRICLGHFGWPWVRETAMLMLKYPNVYTDTACLYFDSAREFYLQTFTRDIPATWIDRSLRHQVMFGSDNPRFEQIRMASALEELGLRDSTLELIRGRNALEFLGLKQEGDPVCM